MDEYPQLHWQEGGAARSAIWRSESGTPPPRKVQIADDTLAADVAYRLACEGAALLWRGDFHNAKQLLQALGRRAVAKPRKASSAAGKGGPGSKRKDESEGHDQQSTAHAPLALAGAGMAAGGGDLAPAAAAFHLHRQAQAQRARVLGKLLIELQPDRGISLRRAPDLREAVACAWGAADRASAQTTVISLRELLGLVGAHEWRKNGVRIPALDGVGDGRIHPHYGVFSPLRGEYVQLVAQAPLPSTELALDIGTGSGVLAAVLAHRGVHRVIATDQDPRALACAQENLARLGLAAQVELLQADLFAPLVLTGPAPLIVCNPPWVPARANSPIEHAVYDPDSRMLRGFLNGLAAHLAPGGEGWLILSDLAEHLALRPRSQLMGWIAAAGLQVLGRLDARPNHPKAANAADPLHRARAAEVTSLWRLGAKG